MHWWLVFTLYAYVLAQTTPRNLTSIIQYVGFTPPPQRGTTPSTGLVTKLPQLGTTTSPRNNILCGTRNDRLLDLILPQNIAKFGVFPWMVIVLQQYVEDEGLPNPPVYRCGGSLIHPQVVMTAAHCVQSPNYKYSVRAGEWNLDQEDELYVQQERRVRRVIIHPEYYSSHMHNAIALLILVSQFDIDEDYIRPICLPRQGQLIENTKCCVSGWSMNAQGVLQDVLERANLSIESRFFCKESVNEIYHFVLHDSLLCASIERDVCRWNTGGPLMCSIPNMKGTEEKYFQAGIVSLGFGCEEPQVLGLYTDVTKFVNWINNELAPYNFDKSYYTY